MFSPGQVIGDYRLTRRLGVGGMAEVWVATHPARKDPVAIKTLTGRDPTFVTMFLDEAAIGAKLHHPAIVRVEACFQFDGAMFQVMELVDGMDVRRALSRAAKDGKSMPPRIAAYVASELAGALAYVHGLTDSSGTSMGLIHRDVSPHNVMLGFDGRVHLLDFGIAKARDRLAKTGAGVVKGKLGYLSPERIQGFEVTPACDVWALGVVLWEMLAGRPMFASLEPMVLASELLRGDVAPLPADVSPALVALVRAMLVRAKAQRLTGLDVVRANLAPERADAAALASWLSGAKAKPRAPTAVLSFDDEEPTEAVRAGDTTATLGPGET